LLYIYNYSLLLDVKILMQTVRVMLQGEQAPGLKKRGVDRRVQRVEFRRIAPIEKIIEPGSSQTD